MLIALAICSWQSRTNAYEPVASGITFFNRTGAAIPGNSLRFAEGGWIRGRDQGFAFALQKNTSYFYLWIQGANGELIGRRPYCDGNLADRKGEAIRVDAITSFALADLSGNGSSYLIALTDGGRRLIGWNLTSCKGQATIRATAQNGMPHAGSAGQGTLGSVVAGDFEGTGKDLIATIMPDTAELLQWELEGQDFRVSHRAVLHVAPNSESQVRGIQYIGLTRLAHEKDNVAYEAAIIVLHDRGFTLFRNGQPIAFAPNCSERPAVCVNKTLLFSLDQGLTDGLQDLAHKDHVQAGQVLDRIVAALRPAQRRYAVWALISPIHEDRHATVFILDRLAYAGIPFVLDYYSSDITSLAYIKKDWVDYKPNAFAPLKGISLDIGGSATSAESLDFYSKRYGAKFIGVRIFERLGIDINAKDPNGQPMIADEALAERELTFDWKVSTRVLEWARKNEKFVIWADPWLYLPYECYMGPAAVAAATKERDDYIQQQRRLAARFPNLIPMYDNNEGLKRCGVAYGNWLMTPRNFRLTRWGKIPTSVASVKRGHDPLTGTAGFGLSVQSWTTDYDSVLSAGTLPAEEVAIWTLDGFARGASIIEFEPYFYFLAWPPAKGSSQSVPIRDNQRIGDPRETLQILFSNLAIDSFR